jgi:hypothetical protein
MKRVREVEIREKPIFPTAWLSPFSSSVADQAVDKLFYIAGSGFASAVVRNLVMAFCSNSFPKPWTEVEALHFVELPIWEIWERNYKQWLRVYFTHFEAIFYGS